MPHLLGLGRNNGGRFPFNPLNPNQNICPRLCLTQSGMSAGALAPILVKLWSVLGNWAVKQTDT